MDIRSERFVDQRRRGAVAAFVVVMLVVLVGFAAMTVDVGNLYMAKGDLQRAADAAALAGASAFADDALREQYADPDMYERKAEQEAERRALAYSIKNFTTGVETKLQKKDIRVGYFNTRYPNQPLDFVKRANAVEVTARFEDKSINGPVSNFFASILGFAHTDVSATATAAFDTRLSAYTPGEPGSMMPFTIFRQQWDDQVANGPDNFGFDEDTGYVQNLPDSKPEVVLFPYKDDPAGGDGAGNFGILNIGVDNEGAETVEDQILDGLTPEQIEAETGVPYLTFLDENNEPTTYEMTGNPGVKGGLEDILEAKVGDVVGFFLHDYLVDTGSGAIYTIVRLEFGRLMEVELSGNFDVKRLVIQPVVYTDGGVDTDPEAPEDGDIGVLMLVK